MTVHDLKLACPSYKMLRDGRVCEDCRGGRVYNVLRHRCVKGSAPLSAVVLAETVLHRLLGLYRDKVDRLVVPSRFYLEKLAEWGWPREKMVHIANFVDVTALSGDWPEGDYFAFAGRVAPKRPHDPDQSGGFVPTSGWSSPVPVRRANTSPPRGRAQGGRDFRRLSLG